MSSSTSSRSILTISPSTMSPSLKSRSDVSIASRSSSGVRSRSGAAFVSLVVSIWTISLRHAGADRRFVDFTGPGRPAWLRDGSCPAETPSTHFRYESVAGGYGLRPVRPPADVGAQRNGEVVGRLHLFLDDLGGLLDAVLRDLEHQLVVDGQEHPALEARLTQRLVHAKHAELEHVGRAPLDRRVE